MRVRRVPAGPKYAVALGSATSLGDGSLLNSRAPARILPSEQAARPQRPPQCLLWLGGVGAEAGGAAATDASAK